MCIYLNNKVKYEFTTEEPELIKVKLSETLVNVQVIIKIIFYLKKPSNTVNFVNKIENLFVGKTIAIVINFK